MNALTSSPVVVRARGAWQKMPLVARAGLQATMATIFFAVMHVLIRYISQELHALQIVFFRNFLALLWLTPWLLRVGPRGLRTQRLGLFGIRALVGFVAMTSGFWALTLIPVTQVTALSFAAPLFATIGAVIFLGEVVKLRRWTAVIVGFLGTMIVLQPGMAPLEFGVILALVNAAGMAGNKLITKSLARTESTESIITYMVLLLTPLSLIPALFVWQWPSLHAMFWMVVLAGLGTCGHWLMTSSYAKADVSFILPFDFLRLPWTALLAFILFAEVPSLYTWIGGAVIFGATFYITHREARIARANRTKEASAPGA